MIYDMNNKTFLVVIFLIFQHEELGPGKKVQKWSL